MSWWQADLASILPDPMTPNPAQRRAAEEIASPERWTLLVRTGEMVWGEYAGTGVSPYRMVVDLTSRELTGAQCSCPSRKDPCKHILALILLLQGGLVPEGAPPGGEWLPVASPRGGRSAFRSPRGATRGAEPASPGQGLKAPAAGRRSPGSGTRRPEREARMLAGLDELAHWLDDLVRNGLGALVTRETAPDRSALLTMCGEWERMARRLIDAQAPGLARRVRRAAARLPASARPADGQVGQNLVARLVEELAMLHLAIEGYRRRDQLTPDELIDLEIFIGWPQRREEALATLPQLDDWLVLGRQELVEDRLWERRTWLAGRLSGRMALLRDYQPAPFAADPESLLRVGTTVPGEIYHYPGAVPLRAVLESRTAPAGAAPVAVPVVFDDGGRPCGVLAGLEGFARALAANPWLEIWPLRLCGVVPTRHRDGWMLLDQAGQGLPLSAAQSGDLTPWMLLALGGGWPVDLFGEWDGAEFRVLTIWREGRWCDLSACFTTCAVQAGQPREQSPDSGPDPGQQMGEWIDLVREFSLGPTHRLRTASLHVPGSGPPAEVSGGEREYSTGQSLWQRAAIMTLRRRAGYRPLMADPGRLIPLPDESRPPESAETHARMAVLTNRLGEILERRPALLPEWLQRLAEVGGVLPPAAIPRLLDLAVGDAGLAQLVWPVLGRRGEWLAGGNPAWRQVVAAVEKVHGAADSAAGKVALPEGARGQWWRGLVSYEPRPFGRDTIEIHWSTPPGMDNLPEPDRGLQVDGTDQFEVVVPTGARGATVVDLTDLAIHLDRPFAAALARIDPRFWEETWGRSPWEIVRSAARSPWREALLASLTVAAARFGAADWFDPLVAERLQEPTEEGLEIFPLLAPGRQEHWIMIALQQSRSLEVDQPAFWVLTRSDCVWGRSLADSLWPLMRREIEVRTSPVIWDWELLLARAAERFDPELATMVADFLATLPAEAANRVGPFGTVGPAGEALLPALRGLLDTLRFRAAMLDELRIESASTGTVRDGD